MTYIGRFIAFATMRCGCDEGSIGFEQQGIDTDRSRDGLDPVCIFETDAAIDTEHETSMESVFCLIHIPFKAVHHPRERFYPRGVGYFRNPIVQYLDQIINCISAMQDDRLIHLCRQG